MFARDPGFVFAANLGSRPLPLPPHREVLLASGALAPDGALPRDTAVWLAT
jgi:alpha-glucosidase